MQTVGLSWQHSFEAAATVAAVGGIGALAKDARLRTVAAFLREVAVIGALYGLWQLAGKLSLHDTGDAFARARWIERVQNDFLLDQHGVQRLLLHSDTLAQAANLYYATMHFTMMFVFLLWLFWRHRDRYRPVRQVMAWTTLGCLLIQLVPVAPPRMLPGYIDTAARFKQSVYSGGIVTDQLSAMPSVHVAWCLIVGYYTWRIAASRWRFLGPLHAVITIFVVTSTANHWWADGIVAGAVLLIVAWSVYGIRTAWSVFRTRRIDAPRVGSPDFDPAQFDPTEFDPTAPDSSVLPRSAAQTT